MRSIHFVLLSATLLCSCALIEPSPYEILAAQSSEARKDLDSGKISESEFFSRMYRNSMAMNDYPSKYSDMMVFAELSHIAQEMESGKISREEYEYRRRKIIASGMAASSAAIDADAARMNEQTERLRRAMKPTQPPPVTCLLSLIHI